MICGHCGAEIPPDSPICPHCGTPIDERFGEDGDWGVEREVYSLLATANLYRVRGLWQEAENKCVEVLRRYPNNPAAHSLLGDIYADQGRWEEAKEWYELAIELAPSSQADKKKLERVKRILAEREKISKSKMITWGALAFALMLISFSVFLFTQWRKSKVELPISSPSFLPNLPSSSPTPPISLPAPSENAPPLTLYTPREENIRQSIMNAGIQEIEKVRVVVDAAKQKAMIDVFSRVPFNYQDVYSLLTRISFPVLQAAAQADPEISSFTLRLLVPQDSTTEEAFQGSISREEITQATNETILSLFHNVWWNPSLTQLQNQ